MTREHRTMGELPPLPLGEWEATKETLHRYCQVVGRMSLSPSRNHWWHVTLYVTTRGLSTGPIPYGSTAFDITLDLLGNELKISTNEGGTHRRSADGYEAVQDTYGVAPGMTLVGHAADAFPARDPEEFLAFIEVLNTQSEDPERLDRHTREHVAARPTGVKVTVLGRVFIDRVAQDQTLQRTIFFDPSDLPQAVAFAEDPMIEAHISAYRLAAARCRRGT